MNANEIIENLKLGNKRFISQGTLKRTNVPADFSGGQSPHTIILTCADSRVPPELIFDQDLGDVFVIRLAGNIVTDEALGSIEYAVANLGSKVCMVLGHTSCGAVGAAVEVVKNGASLPSKSLESVVEPIKRPVEMALKDGEQDLVNRSVTLNVNSSVELLTEKSSIIKEKVLSSELKLVGAVYQLASGEVKFL